MIGVVGTSHRCADLATREAIARALASAPDALRRGTVLLLTCNRAEWYFCTNTPATAHQEMTSFLREAVDHTILCQMYTLFGLECVHHLAKVVSGMDSLFAGETEIQGQVRAAYEAARQATPLPKELHLLFQRALHTGKVIRRRTAVPPCHGLYDQVLSLVTRHMKEVMRPAVLLVGASAVNCALAHALKDMSLEITVANRTEEKAQALASEIGGHLLPWHQLSRLWCQFPCVITAARSSEYLLSQSNSSSSLLSQLLIDLGVPRNIDPSLSSQARRIVNIESFAPSRDIDEILTARSQHDYLRLSQQA